MDITKTFQCVTCEGYVEILIHTVVGDDGLRVTDLEAPSSSCKCRISWLDWLHIFKDEGGLQIEGRIFGSESRDLTYGHTVSSSSGLG